MEETTRLKTTDFLFLFTLLYLIFLNTPLVVGDVPPLNLTVVTDKPVYLQEESIEVSGTLSVGINPIHQWPVAVSINFPNGTLLVDATPETDQYGNFAMTLTLPPATALGIYTVLSSVQWNTRYAMRELTFEVRPTEEAGPIQPGVPQKPSLYSPVLLTLIATVVAFSLIVFALIFCGLVAFQKKVEAPVAPVTPITPVRKVSVMPYKTCAKCGRTFLGVHTFCPHCLTYHGKDGYIERITL